MNRRSLILLVALALWASVGEASRVLAQGITNPVDNESYDNTANISVSGWIVDAPNTVIIKMRRQTTGTIVASATTDVADQDGTGQGTFSGLMLNAPVLGWPVGWYNIELWESGGTEPEAYVQIQIVKN